MIHLLTTDVLFCLLSLVVVFSFTIFTFYYGILFHYSSVSVTMPDWSCSYALITVSVSFFPSFFVSLWICIWVLEHGAKTADILYFQNCGLTG